MGERWIADCRLPIVDWTVNGPGVHQSSIGGLRLSGAAAAALAFGDETERAVKRTILAVDRSAAHGAGEADEFVRDGSLGPVAPHSPSVQTGLQAHDLFPRDLGISDVISKFFGGDVPEFVLRGELKPCNEKVSGPLRGDQAREKRGAHAPSRVE